MKNFFLSLHKHNGCFTLMLSALLLLFTGCAGTGKPQYNIETYLLNYPAPSGQLRTPLAASIKFNRFSIAAVYNTANMIFRSDAYSIDSFNYSRWAVNPADMIADDLLRDLRTGGLFLAVFSRHDTEDGRFIISGGVEEFYLNTDGKTKTAVIGLVISLHDAREIRTSKKMLFQKKIQKGRGDRRIVAAGICPGRKPRHAGPLGTSQRGYLPGHQSKYALKRGSP